jgi:hypothetical protein
MEIYIITADPLRLGGGKAVRVYTLFKGLSNRGYKVNIIEPPQVQYYG